MKLSTRYGLIGLGALAVLSAAHWTRDHRLADIFVTGYVLGVLPNLAAAVAIPFVAIAIWADHRLAQSMSAALKRFGFATCVSCVGLVAWEFGQQGSRRLVFDVHDIGATFLGTGIAWAAFWLATAPSFTVPRSASVWSPAQSDRIPRGDPMPDNVTALRGRSVMPSLTVNNLQESQKFFTALGFEIEDRWEDQGVLLGLMLKSGDARLGLSQDDGKKGANRVKGVGVRLYVEADGDLDAAAARAKAAGVTVQREPYDTDWGTRAFEVTEPSGFLITISSPAAKS